MSFEVPQERRFQHIARVNGAALDMSIERDTVMRNVRRRLVEEMAAYIVEKCMSQDTYQGFSGSTLHLDVYVLSPTDLHEMIDRAYVAGLKSKERFAYLDPKYMKET